MRHRRMLSTFERPAWEFMLTALAEGVREFRCVGPGGTVGLPAFGGQGRPCLVFLLLVLHSLSVSRLSAQTRYDYDRARQKMVSEYIEKEGVTNPRVLRAMRTVPRHEFVPSTLLAKAYYDAAWPIGYKQTISPPFIVAYMTQVIDPQPSDRVLEIGTGSGYQAAVLSGLAKEIYTIEIVDPLGKAAARRLKRLGYSNVHAKVGDGYLGWPEHAPFDKIIVTCSPENVPKPLVEQLREGGRIVIPLGERYDQVLYLVEKHQGKLVRKMLKPTLFVPMTGKSDGERTTKPDPLNPHVNNGGFETLKEDGSAAGWHYQREMTLDKEQAQEGQYCVRFDNDEPGRIAQALQGLAIDGRQIGSVAIKFKFRAEKIADGPLAYNQAGFQIHFYDNNRTPLGIEVIGRWNGSFNWQSVTKTVPVPEAAREAILRIGLNGATGHLYLDDIKLTPQRRDARTQ